MSVQDDIREQELCNLFNLVWSPDHERSGVDATLEYNHDGKIKNVEFEVKSTTTATVSTARDVGMDHINKWRTKHWIIGFYDKSRGQRPTLLSAMYLSPLNMKEWIDKLEDYISPDFMLSEICPKYLKLRDLYTICGEKEYYSIEDARKIYKKQWKTVDYESFLDYPEDSPELYSKERMLMILQKRVGYTMQRGATLNNPHIPKSFLKKYSDNIVSKEHAIFLREKLDSYFLEIKK